MTLTYPEAKEAARRCASYAEVDALLKGIEAQYDTISDSQYYNVKHIAINAAYKAMST